MRVIKGLFDRIIFAVGVLLFMQVPHFVDLYEQRLGGYHQAQVEHLQQYQDIANQQYHGDLTALIKEFNSSDKRSVQRTASSILNTKKNLEGLNRDVQVLATKPFVLKLFHLSTRLKFDIAQATMYSLKPAFPLSLEALVCGILGGVLLSLLFNMFFNIPKFLTARNSKPKKQSRSEVKRRIEPTVMRPARAA